MTTFGLDRELEVKAIQKYNLEDEQKAIEWIQNLTSENIGTDFLQGLKSGVILCKLIRVLFPDMKLEFVSSPRHYLEEHANIKTYLSICERVGVPSQDSFTIPDITRDRSAVLRNIYAVARQAQAHGWNGEIIGVRYYKTVQEQNVLREKKQNERMIEEERKRNESEMQKRKREELEKEKRSMEDEKAERYKKRLERRRGMREERGRVEPAFELHSTMRSDGELAKRDISPVRYGIDQEIEKGRMKEKEDIEELENIALDWIEDVTDEQVDSLYLHLKSGRTLCKLINQLCPNSVPRIHSGKRPIQERENIALFLDACKNKIGIKSSDLFEVNELYEARDLQAVLRTIYSLSRAMSSKPDYKGPLIERQYIEKELQQFFLVQGDGGYVENQYRQETWSSYIYKWFKGWL